MLYRVIGLMSGSSLDGLDIAYVHLTETRGQWSYQLEAAACVPYSPEWQTLLKNAPQSSGLELARLHTAYGHYLGKAVQAFRAAHDLEHGLHFIASHGHTVFHEPHSGMTCQIGEGAAIAAETGLPVISDLRLMDVALGGQGAPIVPVGDQLLFGDYDAWLNLGGIANVTIRQADDSLLAFDVCPCNQVLNALAAREGLAYDAGGQLAATGALLPDALERLRALPYYDLLPPKSLANTFSTEVLSILNENDAPSHFQLFTAVTHIAEELAKVIQTKVRTGGKVLVTGGGALNDFLLEKINSQLHLQHIVCERPETPVVHFKEAIVMALIGALRWREETNVLASVTGAKRDSINGALWLP